MKSKNNWFKDFKSIKSKLVVSLIILAFAIFIYMLSGDFVSDRTRTAISPDIFIDNFGPYNLLPIYIWLFLAVIAVFIFYPLIFKPKELPYVICMFSLFVVIRSGFIMLTHLRPPADAVQVIFPGALQVFAFSNDLFFSGHTGLPYLGFLLFYKHKTIRYFMLASSIALGLTVLLMHVHYSIDVASAFFITYAIFHFGNRIFKKFRVQTNNIG